MVLWKQHASSGNHEPQKGVVRFGSFLLLKQFAKIASLITAISLLAGCATFKPQALDYASIDLVDSPKKKQLEYAVYTPPNWKKDERLPLVVFLHGGADSHQTFEQYGAHLALDKEIDEGRMPRAIVVLPNGDNGFWENWVDGTFSYRDWVLKQIVPKVQQDYQTLDCPDYCHLAGISMGGFGALRMAVFAHHQFSSVAAISAPIFYLDGQAEVQKPSLLWRLLIPYKRMFGKDYAREGNPTNPYNAFIDESGVRDMRLMLIRGTEENDHIIKFNEAFHKRLNQANIAHKYVVYEGGHKWRYWIPQLGEVMRFLLKENASTQSKDSS